MQTCFISWDQLIISLDEVKKLLNKHYGYGWTLKGFLPTLRNQPKNYYWNYFVDKFKALPLKN